MTLTAASAQPSGTATLTVRLAGDSATGTIALPALGQTEFTLPPATGIEGLYIVDALSPTGEFTGASTRNGHISGTITTTGQLTETITAPDGTTITADGTLTNYTPDDTATYQGLRIAVYQNRATGVSRHPGRLGFMGKTIEL